MKVGDYVRTKFGQIGKLEYIGKYNINIEFGKHIQVIAKTEDYKSSPNIIDLIEVGDYVNGCYVDEVFEYEDGTKGITICDSSHSVIFNDEKIKSIVTKEQFKSIEYKVGD